MDAVTWTARFLSCLILILTTGCAPRLGVDVNLKGGSEAANAVACAVFDPIYLEDQEIMDLTRKSKEKIAGHNAAWEKLCATK